MTTPPSVPIAIVGLSLRMPGGCDDLAAFWRTVREGRFAQGSFSEQKRWSEALVGSPELEPGKVVTDTASLLSNVDLFDSEFFEISAGEAAVLDPQHRMMLELSVQALDDAGIPHSAMRELSLGVFVGLSSFDYGAMQAGEAEVSGAYAHDTAHYNGPNRISYFLDARGPSLVVDAACATSALAAHLACQSLRAGECDAALLGSSSLHLHPLTSASFSALGTLAKDGRCKPFDASGDGYGRGEAALVFVLKRLPDAIAANDRIHAVIRASATSHGGRNPLGFTSPRHAEQAKLMRRVLDASGFSPEDVTYFEAHGTGTIVGDREESRALGEVFGQRRGGPLPIGSIKACFNHAEGAAGLCGLLKAVALVKNRELPPTPLITHPREDIDFDGLGLRLPDRPEPLADDEQTVVGVNSFGIGGAYVAMVVSQHREQPRASAAAGAVDEPPPRPLLLPFSTKHTATVGQWIERQRADLQQHHAETRIDDIVYTLCERRTHHPCRSFAVAESVPQLIDALAAPAKPRRVPARRPELTFIYTGMGPQWWRMGRDLLASEPVFRQALERFDAIWAGVGGWSLLDEMRAPEARCRIGKDSAANLVANVALQLALTELWRHWGIAPDSVVGHSVGELAAGYVVGALSLEQLAALAKARMAWTAAAEGQGTMAAVGLSVDELAPFLETHPGVDIAAYNAPSLLTVSGDERSINALASDIEATGAYCRVLRVTVPYHGRYLRAHRETFEVPSCIDSATSPRIPYYSAVSGQLHERPLDGEYWLDNLCQPVRFQAAIEAAAQKGVPTFVEVGPHPVLRSAVEATVQARELASEVDCLCSLRRHEPERRQMLEGLGRLYQLGYEPDWRATGLREDARLVELPSAPWRRQRLWSESEASFEQRMVVPQHALLGMPQRRVDAPSVEYSSRLSVRRFPFLRDHGLRGELLLAGACFVEMMREAAATALSLEQIELTDVTFEAALFFEGDAAVYVRTVVDELERTVQIYSARSPRGAEWTLHARCGYGALGHSELSLDFDAGPGRGSDEIYTIEALNGLRLENDFRVLASVRRSRARAHAKLADTPAQLDYLERALRIEACFQMAWQAEEPRYADTLALPYRARRIQFRADRQARHVLAQQRREGMFRCPTVVDAVVYADADEPIVVMEALERRTAVDAAGVDWSASGAFFREELELVGLNDEAAEAAASEAQRRDVIVLGDGAVADALGAQLAPPIALSAVVADLPALEAELQRDIEAPLTVVDVRHASAVDLAASAFADELAARSFRALDLARWLGGWAQTRDQRDVALVLATVGADEPTALQPRGATHHMLTGIARVVGSEYPQLTTKVVQVQSELELAGQLAAELGAGDTEGELVWRAAQRHAIRLAPAPATTSDVELDVATDQRWSLEAALLPEGGRGLVWRASPRSTLGPEQVRVEVVCAALNFRDVLKSMGLYPADDPRDPDVVGLGDECVGVVKEVGADVTHLRVGQRVIARSSGECLASEVCLPAAQVFVKPAGLEDAAAACVPVVFSTAWYALHTVARLREGERVLIHSGTGGVGLAAIQIARDIGAEIYATAGTESKRALLRSMKLDGVYDSKSLHFADQMMEATAGEGIDAVLNSVVGSAMSKSLSLLRDFGRFLEIGKRDLFDNTKIGLYALRNNVSYHAIDLSRVWRHRPQVAQQVSEEVLRAFAEGRLEPLPVQVFGADEAKQAFDAMADRARVGKVALEVARQRGPQQQPGLASARFGYGAVVRPDATYLLTGGFGGIGRAVLRWLARAGARHAMVLSRGGASTPEKRALLASLADDGLSVEVHSGSVADAEVVAEAVARIDRSGRPLAGVIHLAGVLRDKAMADVERTDFDEVLAPKVAGAWNLHRLTAERPLDMFVLFSSISVMDGTPGQVSYCAANAFLDWLARYRRARGLAGHSLGWGPFIGSGMVDDTLLARYEHVGLKGVTAAETVELFDGLLPVHEPHVYVRRSVWSRFLSRLPVVPKRYERLARSDESQRAPDSVLARYRNAPMDQRPAVVSQYLREAIADVVGCSAEAVSETLAFADIGVDSLTVMNLANRVSFDVGVRIAPVDVGPKKTLVHLRDVLLAKLADGAESAVPRQSPAPTPEPSLSSPSLPLLPGQLGLLAEGGTVDPPTLSLPITQTVPLIFDCKVPMSAETAGAIVDRLVERHEALRAQFTHSDGRWQQQLRSRVSPEVRVAKAETRRQLDELRLELLYAPWRLAVEPAIRCALVEGPSGQVLMLAFNHLAVDLISIYVLVGDILALCDAAAAGARATLPSVSLSFSAWAHRLLQMADDDELARCRQRLSTWASEPRLALVVPREFRRSFFAGTASTSAILSAAWAALRQLQRVPFVRVVRVMRPDADLTHTVGMLTTSTLHALDAARDNPTLARMVAEPLAVAALDQPLRRSLNSRTTLLNAVRLIEKLPDGADEVLGLWPDERARDPAGRPMRREDGVQPFALGINASALGDDLRLRVVSRVEGVGDAEVDRFAATMAAELAQAGTTAR